MGETCFTLLKQPTPSSVSYALSSSYFCSVLQVYFTLLEMSGTHFVKLYNNKTLDKDKDRATIHYCRPLDILVEEDRNILIENFMRFNNFQQVREAVYT